MSKSRIEEHQTKPSQRRLHQPPLRPVTLEDKYALDQADAYLTGIEALVRLPILQHQRDLSAGLHTAGFISGYRGSPLATLDQSLWQAEPYLSKHHIKFVPGINEDLAATAVRGSQEVGLQPGSKYDGVFGMWYGKAPGLDRSLDAFRHANAAGTAKHGGVLAVVGDDHGCKSSTYPSQSEHLFMSLSMPILAPANVQEVLDLGVYGWELSRYSGCWVGLKAITENMDSAISAKIDPTRIRIRKPVDFELPEDGLNVRWPDSAMDQEERLNKFKIYAARAFALENELNQIVIDTPNPRLGIVTSGKSYLDVMQAFEDLGIDARTAADIGIRVFKVGMPWPLEPVKTHEFARGLSEILVVEEKRSVIEDQLTGQLYNWPVKDRPQVVGEYDEHGQSLLPNIGELTPAMVARVIADRIADFYNNDSITSRIAFINRKERRLARDRVTSQRKASFCSGCPHNTSTQVPEGSIAGGGIGCHYMSTWMQNRPAHNFTHMGGEGVTWTGIAPFTETDHIFQNMGDGTYFHSGLLAIRQSVSSGVNITYKILLNGAVAMTGGQGVDGELTVAQLISQLQGEGVKRIDVVSDAPQQHRSVATDTVKVWHRDDFMQVQNQLRDTPGTTVLIYEQACATAKRRLRKRGELPAEPKRVMINHSVCEGCGDCSKQSNCLSVVPKQTPYGRKRQIDQSACNQDFSCLKGFCPSFVTITGGKLRKQEADHQVDFSSLTEPNKPTLNQPWNVVITGIGGTGVLTIAAVLSMAAHLEYKGVATLNQTGLAQKFGPVTSHLRIAKEQADIHAVRIPAGDADLLLGCDLAVAATDESLSKLQRLRSHVVVNDTLAATAEFIDNPDVEFHIEPMKSSLLDHAEEAKVGFVPAGEICKAIFANTIATNFFMVGVAYQRGLLPLSEAAILEALRLNGVEVDFNQRAFLWGRMAEMQPDLVQKMAGLTPEETDQESGLQYIVADRYKDLIAYQDAAYADRYQRLVNRVLNFEQKHQLQSEQKLSHCVANTYHWLLAYKDEYEIGRLFTDGRFAKQLAEEFEEAPKLHFHFSPPFWPRKDAQGMPRKIKLGGWIMPLLGMLKRLKWLRGTRFDLFGYSKERQMERALITMFEDQVDLVLSNISKGQNEHTLANGLMVLDSFNQVRGFGHVKQGNFDKFEADLNRLERPIHQISVEVADRVA
ncbi:MAG: indolepyruvate ferredoxin oxidoreductase family protein [Pseudomonadota bacterium]